MRSVKVLASAVVAAVLLAGSAAASIDIAYRLTIEEGASGLGRVEATISGIESDGFTLGRAKAAGTAWFDNVTAVAKDGTACSTVPVESGYYITTGSATAVTLTYTIRPGILGNYGHMGLISEEFAALDGSMLFLVPVEPQINSVEFSFDVPVEWKPAMGWMKSEGGYKPSASFAPLREQLERSLVCFGDFRTVKRVVGTNTLAVHLPASYEKASGDSIVDMLLAIYIRLYEVLDFETGCEYNMVCLPPAPDGLPVVAGAWADGQAMTLVGRFAPVDSLKLVRACSRFMGLGYFAEGPFAVKLSPEDEWLYHAFLVFAEAEGGITSGKTSQNLFYGSLYTPYSAEASADNSLLDLALARIAKASADAAAFMSQVKAPVLLMRLDFEIRAVTDGALGVEDFLKALYRRGGGEDSTVDVLAVLAELTGVSFEEFDRTFVQSRALILPAWPEFVEGLAERKYEPGEVIAEVDGARIFEREVAIMCDAILSEGRITEPADIRRAAIDALITEKMIDKALAEHSINVVPEAFWRLRLALPGRVMRILMTRKRQALKDVLYDDWFSAARKEGKVTFVETEAPAMTQ